MRCGREWGKAARDCVVSLCVSRRTTVHDICLVSRGSGRLALARKRQRLERVEKVARAFLVCFISLACHDGHFTAGPSLPRETKWHATRGEKEK
jgi:hypothetical protein